MYKMSDIHSIKLNSNCFLINWHPTKWCNYRCSYCCSSLGRWIKNEELISIASNINNFINEKLDKSIPIYFKILGGEVCYYNWKAILNKIDRINKISITTNFSNTLDYYKDLYIYMKSRNIQYTLMCSHHEENKDYFEKIIELTNWCLQNGFKKPICRLMVDNNFKTEWLDLLKQNNIEPNLSVIRDDNNKVVELNHELKSIMDNYYNKVSNSKVMTVNFKNGEKISVNNAVQFGNQIDVGGFNPDGFKCSAGKNGIYLDPDGEVFKSGCSYLCDKSIGNIKNYKDIELTETSICKLNDNSETTKFCSLCWYINLERIKKGIE